MHAVLQGIDEFLRRWRLPGIPCRLGQRLQGGTLGSTTGTHDGNDAVVLTVCEEV